MRDLDLFQQALGLDEPWQVVGSEFDPERRRLELRLDFPRGARFGCPECERAGCEVHDTSEKSWRHLDFFQHEAHLTARVPRVRCPEHGVHQVELSWTRQGSGFTLLFEALLMAMVSEMPVNAVAGLVGEHDTRVWRVLHHYVDRARADEDLSEVERLGVDETSNRRGQDYVSIFADLDEGRAIFATEGRDAAVPEAEITFDRYHVKAQLSKAVDEVRRSEATEQHELLVRSRYLWLKHPSNLTSKQRVRLDELLAHPLKTARAYRWMLKFDHFYQLDGDAAEHYLRRWCRGAVRSRLKPIIGFAHMIEDHWLGIVRWHHSRVSNGLLEGLNSLVQAAKRRARGYRSPRNYIAIIYLVAGKLELSATHTR